MESHRCCTQICQQVVIVFMPVISRIVLSEVLVDGNISDSKSWVTLWFTLRGSWFTGWISHGSDDGGLFKF